MLGDHYLHCDYTRRHFLKIAGKSALGIGLLAPSLPDAVFAAITKKIHAYIGTYTWRDRSKGIYALTLDPVTGALTNGGPVATTPNPTYLAVHPTKNVLLAVNESVPGQEQARISAFAIDAKTRALNMLNSRPTHGSGACYVSIDRTGQWAFVANYNSGSTAVFPIGADGQLGEASSAVQHAKKSTPHQKVAHAHMIATSPDNRFVLSIDLGLDKVLVYAFDAEKGTLTPHPSPFIQTTPDAGPRHLAFHPDGQHLFVINERNSTLSTYAYDQGVLKALQTVPTLPSGYTGQNDCAAVRVSSDGRFVYGSNRGHNSITAFAFDKNKGALELVGHTATGGDTPRDFNIDPTGAFLLVANTKSSHIRSFRIDQKTGQPMSTGHEVTMPIPTNITFTQG